MNEKTEVVKTDAVINEALRNKHCDKFKKAITTLETHVVKDTWALSAVVYDTIYSDDFSKAFSSKSDYAEAVNYSPTKLSRLGNVMVLRNKVKKLLGLDVKEEGYNVGQMSEMINTVLAIGRKFSEAEQIEILTEIFNDLQPQLTAKEVREKVRGYKKSYLGIEKKESNEIEEKESNKRDDKSEEAVTAENDEFAGYDGDYMTISARIDGETGETIFYNRELIDEILTIINTHGLGVI